MRSREEKQIRSYLLGMLSQEHADALEERLLRDDDFAEWLTLIEDELIEDYARGALNARERKQFESHFLSTPRRRRKLMLVRELRKYSSGMAQAMIAARPRQASWLDSIMVPRWRVVAVSVLVLLAVAIVWRAFLRDSDLDRGLLALNEAYKSYRPIESRVTGLPYAVHSVTRGPDAASSRALDRSAALLQSAVSDDGSAEALHALGRLYLLQKDFDKAITQFEEALKKTPHDQRLHSDLGAALLEKGKLERLNDQSGRSETTLALSLEHLKRALELDDSLLDARFNRALLYEQMKLTPQALEDWEKYLSLDSSSPWAGEARRKIDELRKRNERVTRRGEDLYNEFTTARDAGEEAKVWRVFSQAQSRIGNSITNKLIDTYLALTNERSDEAQEPLQALTQLAALSINKSQDRFTADLAHVYRYATPRQLQILRQARRDMAAAYEFYNQSKHDLAIGLYSRASDSFEQVGDHPEALLARFWISFCYYQRGDEPQQSLSILNEVLAQCEQNNYKWLQAITSIGLANVRDRTAHYSEAIAHAWASYKTSQQATDDNGLLRSLNMLSALYRDVGNYRQSLHLARKGLSLGIEMSADASQMVGFYATSAWNFNALGHYPAALEYEQEALRLGEEMNNPLVRSRYRVQMGLIQGSLKNYDEAIRNIRSGIEIGQSVGEEKIRLEMAAFGQLFLGRAYREAQQFDKALAALNDVLNFTWQNNEEHWLLHEAKKEQLLTRFARGEVAAAAEELERVLDDYEKQREKILEDSNRNNFFAQEQGIYDVAIDFAYSKLTNKSQAFNYSERSRARSLFDTATADWHVVEENIPDLRFSSASIPMSFEEVQKNLPVRGQILQFAVLKEKLIIWYLAHDRFESATVNISSDELLAKVDRLLNLVSRPPHDDNRQLQPVATELYNLLIGPLVQFIDRQRQLCIIPDKVLNLLPFNVLFSSTAGKYLIEDFTLMYASSANVFVRDTKLAHEKSGGEESLLGVGNPNFNRNAFPGLDNLPSATTEVAEIAGFYAHASSLTEAEAKKAPVLKAMRSAGVLHLATHYLPDATSPMLSKLLLATDSERSGGQQSADGVLHAYEIYGLKPLNARLAILAGCRTGVEDYLNGEGAIGLARPFKAAGVPVVIASLWAVDSQATTDLMIGFHRLRTRQGLSSAAALRAAQLEILKHSNPSYHDPYYWASFSLSGGYSDY